MYQDCTDLILNDYAKGKWVTVFLILVFSKKGMFNTDVFYDRRLLFYFLKWVIVKTKSSKWLFLLWNETFKSETSVHIQFWIENCLFASSFNALLPFRHSRQEFGWASLHKYSYHMLISAQYKSCHPCSNVVFKCFMHVQMQNHDNQDKMLRWSSHSSLCLFLIMGVIYW